MAKRLLFVLGFVVFGNLLAQEVSAEAPRDVCHYGEGCQQQPREAALLQFRRSSASVNSIVEEEGTRAAGLGSTADLTEEGFKSVRALCCSKEMLAFVKRLISNKSWEVCDAGGLAGTVVWFDCADDDNPANDYAKLLTHIDPVAQESIDCPWVGDPSRGCPQRKDTCTGSNEKFPPCKDTGTCCGIKTGYSPVHRTITHTGAVTPWNCSAHKGPIQVLTDAATRGAFNISSLDIATGQYTRIYEIRTSRTFPKMDKKLLAAALNPVDSVPYAVISVAGTWYVVRFDESTFEFVAKMAPLKDWSGTTNGNDNIFFAAFGESGTLFFGGTTASRGSVMLAMKDVAGMAGYSAPLPLNPLNLGMPTWEPGTTGLTYSSFPFSSADIAIIRGDFDKAGTSEWLFMLRGNDFKLAIAKIPPDSDISVASFTPIILSTTLDPSYDNSDPTIQPTFGAAWSFQNQVYFSRNNGDGVYHVVTDTIKVAENTYTLELILAGTAVTNNNDGFNCMDVLPPFPGNCTPPEVEIDKVDGKCPV